jgi:hypothetical protein
VLAKLRTPRLLKWCGVSLSTLLAALWLGSMWWGVGWLGRGWGIGLYGGGLGVSIYHAQIPDNACGFHATRLWAAPVWCWWQWDGQSSLRQAYVLPLWLPLSAALVFTIISMRLDSRWRRRILAGRCPSCNYDRIGLQKSSVCPECGEGPASLPLLTSRSWYAMLFAKTKWLSAALLLTCLAAWATSESQRVSWEADNVGAATLTQGRLALLVLRPLHAANPFTGWHVSIADSERRWGFSGFLRDNFWFAAIPLWVPTIVCFVWTIAAWRSSAKTRRKRANERTHETATPGKQATLGC